MADKQEGELPEEEGGPVNLVCILGNILLMVQKSHSQPAGMDETL